MTSIKRLLNTLCLSLTCCLPLNAIAEESADCLDFHVIHSAPLGFVDKDGVTKGVHWDYLSAIAKESGICINKTLFPYARVWESIKLGTHDGGIAFRSKARSHLVEYTEAIRAIRTVVIPLKNKKITDYESLSPLIIGKMRGTHLSEKFDSDKDLSVMNLKSYNKVVEMVKLERVDAISGNVMVLYYQLINNNAVELVDLTNIFTVGQKVQWLQLSKKSKHLHQLTALKNTIKTLKANGTFDAIMSKYYGEQWRVINSH